MSQIKLDEGYVKKDSIGSLLQSALDAGEGLLRLTPTWVPRSFLHPGRRIKLNPADLYAFGPIVAGSTNAGFRPQPKQPTKAAYGTKA